MKTSTMVKSATKTLPQKQPKNLVKREVITVGSLCQLTVTAVGPKNLGIDEFSGEFPIFIPEANLGETVIVKIKRFFRFQNRKYAIAEQIVPPLNLKKLPASPSQKLANAASSEAAVLMSKILTVELTHLSIHPDGFSIGQAIINGSNGPVKVIIPLKNGKTQKVGQLIQIKITKIKEFYALAEALGEESEEKTKSLVRWGNYQNPSVDLTNSASWTGKTKDIGKQLLKGSKMTLILPRRAKKYANHLVILLKKRSSRIGRRGPRTKRGEKPYVLFLKNGVKAKRGAKVRVKFTKIGSTFAIGKIIRIAPNSPSTKLARARKNLNEMLANGMHYGEKVVKFNASMRRYIWNRKSNPKMSSALVSYLKTDNGKKSFLTSQIRVKIRMSKGDQKSPLIKKGRHLINLLKTRRCLNIGLNQITKYAAMGRTFLFVGTKKSVSRLVARAALFSETSFFVNTRWLGGMLTNWKTIVRSIAKIRPILKEKQTVIQNLLEKREIIRNRLVKKALSFRKKSKMLIKKAKLLISKVKKSSQDSSQLLTTQKILMKRKEFFVRGQVLLQTRQSLLKKQNTVKQKTLLIKASGFSIANQYKALSNKVTATHKKLHEIRLMFIFHKELRAITKLAKQQGKNQYTLSDNRFQQFSSLALGKMNTDKLWIIPNPPTEILSQISSTIKGINSWNSAYIPGLPSSTSKVKEKNNTSTLASPSSLEKSIVLTEFLSNFSKHLPYIKNAMNSMHRLILGMTKKMTELKNHLKSLKTKLRSYLDFNKKINAELKLIQGKYTSEKRIIRVLRRKLRRHQAEKKLLQFLPYLQCLSSKKTEIASAIQALMANCVDPKLKYPMDLIYNDQLKKKSKKVAAARKKQWKRLEKYFGGFANMKKLKKAQISNNVAIIIGQQEEMNAVRECKKLGIKMLHLVDTNCKPSLADHIIPSNDDSRGAIKYLLTKIVTRIRLANEMRLRFYPY